MRLAFWVSYLSFRRILDFDKGWYNLNTPYWPYSTYISRKFSLMELTCVLNVTTGFARCSNVDIWRYSDPTLNIFPRQNFQIWLPALLEGLLRYTHVPVSLPQLWDVQKHVTTSCVTVVRWIHYWFCSFAGKTPRNFAWRYSVNNNSFYAGCNLNTFFTPARTAIRIDELR